MPVINTEGKIFDIAIYFGMLLSCAPISTKVVFHIFIILGKNYPVLHMSFNPFHFMVGHK